MEKRRKAVGKEKIQKGNLEENRKRLIEVCEKIKNGFTRKNVNKQELEKYKKISDEILEKSEDENLNSILLLISDVILIPKFRKEEVFSIAICQLIRLLKKKEISYSDYKREFKKFYRMGVDFIRVGAPDFGRNYERKRVKEIRKD